MSNRASIELPGSPFGIAWFFLYGYFGVPAATYMPQVRQLGGTFTKVYLFWNQLEPEKGRFDWTALDAFVEQLHFPDEALISLFSSSQWAARRPSAMLPPSPANNLDDYYRFVFDMVKRCRGRVRYFQNDAEPNSPVFWSGTSQEFVAQLEVFHRAVKDADRDAVVVVGGYDGMFVPPGMVPLEGQRTTPFPQQEAALAFFDHVLERGAAAFDVFDLRLYGDPYSIVARVEYFRRRMSALGCDKPVICTEYGGPNLFEFRENHKYLPLVTAWSQSIGENGANPVAEQIQQLYDGMSSLAPQTQMFMQGCPPELDAKYHRIQSRSIVMRNLFALSAGVQKTLYWDLLASVGERNDMMTLMYGKIGLIGYEDGSLQRLYPSAGVYARMANKLDGVRNVERLVVPDQPSIFLFAVDRGERGPVYVVWERRDAFFGEETPAVEFSWPWVRGSAVAEDAFGGAVQVQAAGGRLQLPVSLTPIYIEARTARSPSRHSCDM